MPYEFEKHTADLRIKVYGDSIKEVFSESMLAMMNILCNGCKNGSGRVVRLVSIDSPDKTALLIDFLNEALYLSKTNKEIYSNIRFNKLEETYIEAILEGQVFGKLNGDIKAVTYHNANIFKNNKGKWETTLVLDI